MYDKAKIMRRAWELMRRDYRFGTAPFFTFNRIGRHCWACCLRNAWAEAKHAARIAAIPATEKAAQIARLRDEMHNTNYLPFGMSATKHRAAIQEQIDQLAA